MVLALNYDMNRYDIDRRRFWQTLWATIRLFQGVAHDVAGQLGFIYPGKLGDQVSAYLETIKTLPHSSKRRAGLDDTEPKAGGVTRASVE